MVFELNFNCVTTVQPKNTRSIVSTVMGVVPGGYSQKNWVGVCGQLLKTLTLFMSKICDIPSLFMT